MSKLSQFFHGSEIHFGFLYPEHYLVAMFGSHQEAEQARAKLKFCGIQDDESLAVAGQDLLTFTEEHGRHDGLWGSLMILLSRAIGTEAVYSDHDLELARHGAGLLVVHCPTRHAKLTAWRCLETAHPAVARYYSAGYIEHFAGET